MSSIPQFTNIKNIPRGFKYYTFLSLDNIKIEPEIKDKNGQIEGYRIWINLNAKASIKKYSIFNIPVIKKRESIVLRYEFNEEFFVDLIRYLVKNWENSKAQISINEVRAELNKKVPEKEFISFYCKDFSIYVHRIAQNLQKEIAQNSTEEKSNQLQKLIPIAKIKLLNPKEEELLSMQDFSQISFNFKKNFDLNKIINYVKNVGLTKEQESQIYSHLEINRLIEKAQLQKEGKHGVLLYGPPGTGKTTTMEAFFKVFGEIGCSIFSINAKDLVSNAYVGGFATQISKTIFEPAIKKIIKYQMPCFIYVDEATSLVSKPKESNVSDWYQEGIDTIKNFLNRSKFPGIILCLATNEERLNNLEQAIVGDDGRLEAVYFGFLNEKQFKVLWKDKLNKNLNLKEEILNNWEKNEYLEKLSKICANLVSGRFVANFCSKYREQYLANQNQQGLSGIIERIKNGTNITKELEEKEIIFKDFYKSFLEKLQKRLKDEIKEGIKEIRTETNYLSEIEMNNKISELENKFIKELEEIGKELENSSSSPSPINNSNNKIFENIFNSIISNLNALKIYNDKISKVGINKIDKNTVGEFLNLLNRYISNLNYLNQNLKFYYRENNIKKGYFKFKNIKKQIISTINILENWKNNGYLTSTQFTFLIKLLDKISNFNK